MRGRNAATLAEVDRQRMVAYELAQWIGIAFHDPKRLPPFKLTAINHIETDDERQRLVDDAKVRGWFISMSMAARH